MAAELKPEWILETLSAQGVTVQPEGARAHATLLSTLLKGTASAYAGLAFEEEPATFTLEQRRNAP